jgi:hypothetical protein
MGDNFIARTNGHSTKEGNISRAAMLDGYNTPNIAVKTILQLENISKNVWEPACGFHKITNVLEAYNHNVYASDVHAWADGVDEIKSFLKFKEIPKSFRKDGCTILTNPPYKLANEFALHALKLLVDGEKLLLLLRLQFLEGISRYRDLLKPFPPKRIYIYSFRLPRMHQFLYTGPEGGSAICFCWVVWEKGYAGDPAIRWIERPKKIHTKKATLF